MRYFFLLVLCFFSSAVLALEIDYRLEYSKVELADYVKGNQITGEMSQENKRLMKQPNAIRFEGWAMSLPKEGQFQLVYDALRLWSSEAELPNVNHSAFVTSTSAPVIGVYVTEQAAKHMESIGLENKAIFYAVHIYTYAKGPRLVIVAAEPSTPNS